MPIVPNVAPATPDRPQPLVRHPTRPDTPTPLHNRPEIPDQPSDDEDLPQPPPDSPDPLNVIDQSFTAQVNARVNHVIALAAALLPQTYAQARASPHWPQIEQAMREEIEKLVRYGAWEVVDHKDGMSVLDARWVYAKIPGLESTMGGQGIQAD